MSRSLSIVLFGFLLFTASLCQAEMVEATGQAVGETEDSLLVREEALHRAIARASATAGIFVSEESTLLDATSHLSTVQVHTAGRITELEIIDESWIAQDTYEIRIRAEVEPRQPDEDLQDRPLIGLTIQGPEGILDEAAPVIASGLNEYGFQVAGLGGSELLVEISEPLFSTISGLEYCELQINLSVTDNAGKEQHHTLLITADGSTEEMAKSRCLQKSATDIAEWLAGEFSSELAGISRWFELDLYGNTDTQQLLRAMEAVAWIETTQLLSRNAVRTRVRVQTSRTGLVLSRWLENRGYRFIKSRGSAMEFAFRPIARQAVQIHDSEASTTRGQGLNIYYFAGGLLLVIGLIYLYFRLR